MGARRKVLRSTLSLFHRLEIEAIRIAHDDDARTLRQRDRRAAGGDHRKACAFQRLGQRRDAVYREAKHPSAWFREGKAEPLRAFRCGQSDPHGGSRNSEPVSIRFEPEGAGVERHSVMYVAYTDAQVRARTL